MGRTGILTAMMAALLAGMLGAQPSCPQAAAVSLQDAVSESDLKAVFLFNFARFTEWPEGAAGLGGEELRIGVLGSESALDPIQKKLSGRSVGKRVLKFFRSVNPSDLDACAMIFVSESEKEQIPAVLEQFRGKPVLTVGESEGFAESGGILNFYVEDKKVKYEINPDALARAQLKATQLIRAAPKKVKSR